MTSRPAILICPANGCALPVSTEWDGEKWHVVGGLPTMCSGCGSALSDVARVRDLTQQLTPSQEPDFPSQFVAGDRYAVVDLGSPADLQYAENDEYCPHGRLLRDRAEACERCEEAYRREVGGPLAEDVPEVDQLDSIIRPIEVWDQ